MHRIDRFPLRAAVAAAAFAAHALAGAVEISLPPDTATFKPSALPGYLLAQRNCMACHSVQYVSTQPPSLGRAYWDATVKKMKKPFGAQFDDADIPAMVDYLVKTYGAERPGAAAKPSR
jgi:mono/diheme cytochrome c family protein